MMKHVIALLVAMALLPVASAHMIVGVESQEIIPGQTATIPITVGADCATEILPGLVSGAGSFSKTVTLDENPYFTSAGATISYSLTDCSSGAEVEKDGTIDITAIATAPGKQTVKAVLTDGDATASVDLITAYVKGYTFTFDQTFPANVTTPMTSFNASITVTANAMSMVMFEIVEAPRGIITGLPEFKNIDPAIDGVMPLAISYQAPAGAWTEDKLVFKTWSHWIDDGNLKTDDQTVTWTFTNGGGKAITGTSTDDKKSPGFEVVGVIGLLGLAAVLRRRS